MCVITWEKMQQVVIANLLLEKNRIRVVQVHGCDLAEPGGPWCSTFALRQEICPGSILLAKICQKIFVGNCRKRNN